MAQPTTAKHPTQLDLVFAALADGTRRASVAQLRRGEATVSELAAPHAMSLPAVSKHLRVLEEAGLLKRKVKGRAHYLTVNAKPLDVAMNWMERQRQFWQGSFDRLAALAEEPFKPLSQTKPNN